MIRGPIVPARIAFTDGADDADAAGDAADAAPRAPDFGDRYHPRIGAFAQARHVFLGGNGLPARWQGRDGFTVLETGFGLGNNFLATWDAWRGCAAAGRPRRLVFVSIERHPPTREDLARAHAASPAPALAAALVATWPPLVPGLHALDFDGGAVRLVLAFGDIADVLPGLRVAADAIFLDGFAPDRNPAMWAPGVLRALAHRTRPGATVATWSAARAVREGLAAAGFVVEAAAGIGGKRDITVGRLREGFRGAQQARPASEAVVVGAGLAGAFTARALADEGWSVRVVDRADTPAAGTSGNPGGLFHGTVHADDGPHARWLRAAALHAARTIAPALARGVPGAGHGLLRLGEGPAMQAAIARHGLPRDWVQALDREAASRLAGVPLPGAAWHFPGGGWVSPAALVRDALTGLPFRGGVAVARVEPLPAAPGGGTRWALLDAAGRRLDAADAVVLANAAAANELAAPWGWQAPCVSLRGQISGWLGWRSPLARPVAGDGYALPLATGDAGPGLLCGATQQAGDDDARTREADDTFNRERLQRLTGLVPPPGAQAFSRAGFRWTAEDRLPIAGALPVATPDRVPVAGRAWPRVEGLWLCTALGGRGITLAPLLGRLLATQIAGQPWPVEQALADAVDPARWLVRAARRRG